MLGIFHRKKKEKKKVSSRINADLYEKGVFLAL
jgi:hypothetical protein